MTNSSSLAEPEYTIILIDPSGAFSHPEALNNFGEITGYRAKGPFIYKDGSIQDLPLSGVGYAINDAGDIVGTTVVGNKQKAFLYSGGQIQYPNLGLESVKQTYASGINNLGQVVGDVIINSRFRGYLYQNGLATLLPNMAVNVNSSVKSINDFGEIIGNSVANFYHSLLYTHGFTVDLGVPPGFDETSATGIDSSGRVSGTASSIHNSSHSSFIYSAGKLTPISTYSSATGINDCGEVVGYGEYFGPFLYTHGVVKSLGDLLAESPYTNFNPQGINNRGEIFGQILINNTYTTLVMIPKVPEVCGLDATIVNTPSSSTVGPGGTITYTITARNLSASTQQFTVADALGRESRLLSCAVSGSTGSCAPAVDGRSVSVDLPSLTKGTTATITVTVHIAGTSGDDQLVMDTATLSSSSTADYLSTAYTNIKLTADLSINAGLVSDDNGLLHYLATVEDLGPDNSHAALLLDPLPANTSFVSVSTTAGTCSFHPTLGTNGSVRCPLGNLAHLVPAKVDVVLKASPAACPSVSNTFSLTGKSIDLSGSNDSSTVVTPLSGAECISGMTAQ